MALTDAKVVRIPFESVDRHLQGGHKNWPSWFESLHRRCYDAVCQSNDGAEAYEFYWELYEKEINRVALAAAKRIGVTRGDTIIFPGIENEHYGYDENRIRDPYFSIP